MGSKLYRYVFVMGIKRRSDEEQIMTKNKNKKQKKKKKTNKKRYIWNHWCTNKEELQQRKTEISLRIHTVWSLCSLSAWRNITSLVFENAPSDDSDQTARMRRLIWIFAGRTCQKVPFLTLRLNYLNDTFSVIAVHIFALWGLDTWEIIH